MKKLNHLKTFESFDYEIEDMNEAFLGIKNSEEKRQALVDKAKWLIVHYRKSKNNKVNAYWLMKGILKKGIDGMKKNITDGYDGFHHTFSMNASGSGGASATVDAELNKDFGKDSHLHDGEIKGYIDNAPSAIKYKSGDKIMKSDINLSDDDKAKLKQELDLK